MMNQTKNVVFNGFPLSNILIYIYISTPIVRKKRFPSLILSLTLECNRSFYYDILLI